MELSDLYSEKILALAANIPAMPRLAAPDGSARRVARVCGSTIEVDLKLGGGVVTGFGYAVSACALGQAATAVVARNIVGSTPGELRDLRARMQAMLGGEGPPPDGRWADLACLEPVRDYRPRHGSTLLVFEAVADALDAIERPGAAAAAPAAG
jgi:NifU-like protein involved in Fe-S cluster formation